MRVEAAQPYYAGYPPLLHNLDALLVTRDAERTIAAQLAEWYGETFGVRCPGPAVRVVADKMTVTCSIEAPDVPRRGVEVRVYAPKGDVRVEPLARNAAARGRDHRPQPRLGPVHAVRHGERGEGWSTIPSSARSHHRASAIMRSSTRSTSCPA